jgi:hypothetical protein
MVHFVQGTKHYAAIVTGAWSGERATLFVLPVGVGVTDVVPGAVDAQRTAHSVPYSAEAGEWSWHWPEREGGE